MQVALKFAEKYSSLSCRDFLVHLDDLRWIIYVYEASSVVGLIYGRYTYTFTCLLLYVDWGCTGFCPPPPTPAGPESDPFNEIWLWPNFQPDLPDARTALSQPRGCPDTPKIQVGVSITPKNLTGEWVHKKHKREKCIQCGQLILRKISKIGATRWQVWRLKCTEFDFCWSSAPDQSIN